MRTCHQWRRTVGNLTFYKDSANTFKCDLEIEGASLSESKARLLLMFENAPTILFNGSISSSGVCEISIPPLKESKSNSGTALLEIIADSTYFESMKKPFTLKNKKNVSVVSESVVVESDASKKTVSVKVETKKVLPQKTTTSPIFTESVNDKNKQMVTKFLHSYKSLTESKKKKLVKEVKHVKFSDDTKKWAKNTFSNPSSTLAKYCMVRVQNKRK